MSDYKVKHDDHNTEEHQDIGEDLGMPTIWGISIAFFFICLATSAWLVGLFGKTARHENDVKIYHSDSVTLIEAREEQMARLNTYAVMDPATARVSIPIDEAKKRALRVLINLERNPPEATMLINGTESKPLNPCAADPENPCAPTEDEAVAQPGTAQHNIPEQH